MNTNAIDTLKACQALWEVLKEESFQDGKNSSYHYTDGVVDGLELAIAVLSSERE